MTRFSGRRALFVALSAVLASPALDANGETPVRSPTYTPAPTPMRSYDPQAQGNKEVEANIGFFYAEGANVGTLNADASFGYYVIPRLSLGIRQSFTYNFRDDEVGDDQWTASTVPFLEYSFATGNPTFRPFLGLFAGGVYNDEDLVGTAGPSVGFKVYLNDSTAVVLRYRFEWFFEDISFEDVTDTSNGNHVATVGFSYSWR